MLIELALKAIILAALLSPVWLLILFLVGWFFTERRRSEAFYCLNQRSQEVRRRIEKTS